MSSNPGNFQNLVNTNRALRRRRSLRDELILALLPTITVLVVLAFVDSLSRERLLFASLAASSFLIYLDPQHTMNRVRTLLASQMMAATIGLLAFLLFGGSFISGGLAMVLTIFLMILLDVVHPPAIATSLAFALRAGNESNLGIFGLAVLITALLVTLQRVLLWLLQKYKSSDEHQ